MKYMGGGFGEHGWGKAYWRLCRGANAVAEHNIGGAGFFFFLAMLSVRRQTLIAFLYRVQ